MRNLKKIDIVPAFKTKGKTKEVKPIAVKKDYEIAKIINEQIKKMVRESSDNIDSSLKDGKSGLAIGRLIQRREESGLTGPFSKLGDISKMSLVDYGFKANDFKNQTTNMIKNIPDLDTGSDSFKQINTQKAVLDKLADSLVSNVQSLRAKRGKYNDFDKNRLNNLPSQLQNVENEFNRLKTIIEEYNKKHNIPIEEKNKQKAISLLNKLKDVNNILDYARRGDELNNNMIKAGPDIDNLIQQIREPGVLQNVRDSLLKDKQDFDEKFDIAKNNIEKLKVELRKQIKNKDHDEHIIGKKDISAIETNLRQIDDRLNDIENEQETLISEIKTGTVNANNIVRFKYNINLIETLVNNIGDLDKSFQTKIQTKIGDMIPEYYRKVKSIMRKITTIIEILYEDIRKLSPEFYMNGCGLYVGRKRNKSYVTRVHDASGNHLFLPKQPYIGGSDEIVPDQNDEEEFKVLYDKKLKRLIKELKDKEPIFEPLGSQNRLVVIFPTAKVTLLHTFILFFTRYKIPYTALLNDLAQIDKGKRDRTFIYFLNQVLIDNQEIIDNNELNISSLESIYRKYFHWMMDDDNKSKNISSKEFRKIFPDNPFGDIPLGEHGDLFARITYSDTNLRRGVKQDIILDYIPFSERTSDELSEAREKAKEEKEKAKKEKEKETSESQDEHDDTDEIEENADGDLDEHDNMDELEKIIDDDMIEHVVNEFHKYKQKLDKDRKKKG